MNPTPDFPADLGIGDRVFYPSATTANFPVRSGVVQHITRVTPRVHRTKPEVPGPDDIVVIIGPDGVIYRDLRVLVRDDAEKLRRLHEEATINAARFGAALEAVIAAFDNVLPGRAWAPADLSSVIESARLELRR